MKDMSNILYKLSCYPTIIYGMCLEYIGYRPWYTRVDEHCIIGALPMKRNYKKIIKKEKVKAILTLNQDHELIHSISEGEWNSMGIDYKKIPIEDYVGIATTEQLLEGIDYIRKHRLDNNCVYVHCKAGRYRSGLFVTCYLIEKYKMEPEEAIQHLKKLRPHVIVEKERQKIAMNLFYKQLFGRNCNDLSKMPTQSHTSSQSSSKHD
jgi:atypical dual specificity phosphatase